MFGYDFHLWEAGKAGIMHNNPLYGNSLLENRPRKTSNIYRIFVYYCQERSEDIFEQYIKKSSPFKNNSEGYLIRFVYFSEVISRNLPETICSSKFDFPIN